MYTEEDWNTKASLENKQYYALSKTLGEVRADRRAGRQEGDVVGK